MNSPTPPAATAAGYPPPGISRPGIVGYILGAILLAIGIGGFIAMLWTGLGHLGDNLTQVVVPGTADVDLKVQGLYTVYLEQNSVVHGKIYSSQNVSEMTCELHSKATGAAVPLYQPRLRTNYSLGKRSGRSVLTFTLDHPGTYTFGCKYHDDAQSPEVVMAIGNGISERIIRTVGFSFFFLFGGLVTGIASIAWTYHCRFKYRRQMARMYPIAR